MPIRTASVTRQLRDNGQALHRAMASRIESQGADQAPSEAERALLEERRQVKAERASRQAQARVHASAVDKLVRTHRAQPKDKPDAPKQAGEPKATKAAAKGHKPSRAEKHATKAAALDAARRAPKKPAKG
ncbi:hypothetical protein [Ideonella sp. BN130291]|uniref:hypothetical protein n=1 Tax=Ideonella sp. BN130291 TaxID=3112940 RepID=UPI002E265874|nr:hypothetical protein [Ideonella sp. BN130291]